MKVFIVRKVIVCGCFEFFFSLPLLYFDFHSYTFISIVSFAGIYHMFEAFV